MIPDEQRKWNTVLLDLDSVASFNERWKSRTPMARLNALHDVIHFVSTYYTLIKFYLVIHDFLVFIYRGIQDASTTEDE